MIATIPPLWRDADAYVQLTQDPRVATFWGHAPAYCYVAKIPLFVGEQWERLRGQPAPRIVPSQPALTDSGIWLLIIAQHLALGIAAYRFITVISLLFPVRLALALVWASNALPYTFAHCLGSETLGLILLVFLVTKGFRLVTKTNEPGWKQWYGFAAILLLCILSRDLHLALVALLPLTFLISFRFRKAVMAIAIGLGCILVAGSLKHDLVRKTKLHAHSRIGFTFLWRLHFLADLSPESRTALLQKIKARAPTERVRYLVTLLEQLHAESPDIGTPKMFMDKAIGFFGGDLNWEDLDRALNQMAFTFLWPPPPELLQAARNDFALAMRRSPTAISEYLFATTTYYFGNKDEIPDCGRLVTFRGDMSPEKIMQLWLHPYFHLWRGVSYLSALGVWLLVLLLLLVLAKHKQNQAGAFLAYAVPLLMAGLAQFVASCLLHDYEPRFSHPLWLFLVCSLFVLVAGVTRILFDREKSAGQPCRSEP